MGFRLSVKFFLMVQLIGLFLPLTFLSVSYCKQKSTKHKSSKHKSNQSGLGVVCQENKDGPEICPNALKLELEKELMEKQKWINTKMSFYGDLFNQKRTSSGNCFNQKDPTLAHSSLPMGTILLLRNKNVLKYGLVTDTGAMASKQKGRTADSAKQLFRELESDDTKGVLSVQFSIIGKVSVPEGEDKQKVFESYIGCMKQINKSTPSEKTESLPAKSAPPKSRNRSVK